MLQATGSDAQGFYSARARRGWVRSQAHRFLAGLQPLPGPDPTPEEWTRELVFVSREARQLAASAAWGRHVWIARAAADRRHRFWAEDMWRADLVAACRRARHFARAADRVRMTVDPDYPWPVLARVRVLDAASIAEGWRAIRAIDRIHPPAGEAAAA